MTFTLGFIVAGVLLIGIALSGPMRSRIPLTTSMLYLGVGFLLGPRGADLISLDPVHAPELLHRLAEIAVIVSLFTAGLKLRVDWRDARWLAPVRLATLSMVVTVALIAVTGMNLLGLSAGAAILLGAVLAPTDPVLASEVEVKSPKDQDQLRFSLTGEAGLNDGTAFPFVMLGLGVLGLHELGTGGWRWASIDLVWAVGGGLVLGAALGTLIGHLVVYLRRTHTEALGMDEFITLGLIALAYGTALYVHAYGFLAVFAAGLALRRVEQMSTSGNIDEAIEELERTGEETATQAETAPLHMAQEILGFNERLGRIGELALVVLVGSLLSTSLLSVRIAIFVALFLFVIRPAAAWLGLVGSPVTSQQRRLICWFGIRGIGSIYYLMYAVEHGLAEHLADDLVSVTVVAIATSIVLHGISVTPLMAWYEERSGKRLSESG